MIHQRFALISILSLAVTIIGCTSATPTATHSGNEVDTTKAFRENDDSILDSQLAFNATGGKKFVNTMRQWSDNESQYSTNAELVSVSLPNRSITLLKENGVTIDVSIDRLSKHDRNFLTQAVHALRTELLQEN